MQCISSKGHWADRNIATARSISVMSLMPVEMKVCLPSAATASKSSSQTIIGDAILLYLRSNDRKNSWLFRSQAEANHSIPFSAQ